MQRLIVDLLAYSRVNVDARLLEVVDAGEALRITLANLEAAIRESGARVTHGPLPHVRASATLLAEVFQNLIANALKYRRGEAPEIHVSAERQNGEWIFAVADNGIGIEAAEIPQLFQLFRRLHGPDEFEGTGIGLATCKKIVERHGGRIRVESEPGRGSTFFFTLPAGGS
jgi:light-regulated signal transduction histidine kinase (bacteriophytochrome)